MISKVKEIRSTFQGTGFGGVKLPLFVCSLVLSAFSAGCGNQGLKSAVPAHKVAMTPFYIDQQEVTVGEYKKCVDESACTPTDRQASQCNMNKPEERKDHPANCVTWKQANKYCRWAGKELPTEAQWEYAAKAGGNAIPYPWGLDPSGPDRIAKRQPNQPASTSPVCEKIYGNTAQGLCDMAGNVAEWTGDAYHDSYKGAPTDGSAWIEPAGPLRTVRGGHMLSENNDSYRTEYRNGKEEKTALSTLGFRCALTYPRGDNVDSPKGAWLGIEIRAASKSLREINDIEQRVAAEITEVQPGSPAEAKGLEAGDIIVEIKGEELKYLAQLWYILIKCNPGDILAIQIIQQGKPKIVDVELTAIPKSK
jgi:sulfatase modifying factor 1